MSEATPEDRLEQAATPSRGGGDTSPPDVPLEATDADVSEQAVPAGAGASLTAGELPLEADPADAAEQAAEVELDEDERR